VVGSPDIFLCGEVVYIGMVIVYILLFLGGVGVGVVGIRWYENMSQSSLLEDEFDADIMRHKSNKAVMERIARRKDRIVLAAQAAGRITNDGVEELFCISDRTASSYLRQLVADGRLDRQGSGRGTFYVPTGR